MEAMKVDYYILYKCQRSNHRKEELHGGIAKLDKTDGPPAHAQLWLDPELEVLQNKHYKAGPTDPTQPYVIKGEIN